MLALLLALPAAAAGIITISDPGGAFDAGISPLHGGELSSFRVRFRGELLETLYRAGDYSPTQGWTGRAPWLWPATGRNEPLPMHGFAKDLPWRVESYHPTRAVLSLADTPETRRQYPYGFRLNVSYEANPQGVLAIRFTVTASKQNRTPMPFSAGNHITFRTPLVPGSDPLAMQFASPSSAEYLKKDRIPTGEQRPRSFSTPVPLSQLERNEPISLGGYETGQPWMTLRDPAGLVVRLWHDASEIPADPVVRFNVWGDAAAGYFSPEPWVGLQNAHNSRQGLVLLKPGGKWNWTIRIQTSSN